MQNMKVNKKRKVNNSSATRRTFQGIAEKLQQNHSLPYAMFWLQSDSFWIGHFAEKALKSSSNGYFGRRCDVML